MIEGKLISLQPFTPERSRRYLEWVNRADVASAVTRARPVTTLEHERWYESAVSRPDAVFFSVVVRETDEYVGNVWLWGIHPVHRSAELRILLGAGAGRGYGSEACQLLLEFAFGQLNLNKLYLYVLESNAPARKCFARAGFLEEGRLAQEYFIDGRYQDALRMGLCRQGLSDEDGSQPA